MKDYHRDMITRVLFAILLAAPHLAAAQEQAFTSRSTALKDRGGADARTVTTLSESTPVKVFTRGGGWARVDAGGQPGWVYVFHLRFPGTAEATSTSSAGGGVLAAIGTAIGGQRADPKANLATMGRRGLSTQDLANSNPNPGELRRMQSFRADRAAAERFAREGKLAAAQVDNPDEASAQPRGGRR
jgi:hypothetical protein